MSVLQLLLTFVASASAFAPTGTVLRAAPKPLAGYLTLYKDWVERFKGSKWNSLAWKLSRKWLVQMAINMMSSIFLSRKCEPSDVRWPLLTAP